MCLCSVLCGICYMSCVCAMCCMCYVIYVMFYAILHVQCIHACTKRSFVHARWTNLRSSVVKTSVHTLNYRSLALLRMNQAFPALSDALKCVSVCPEFAKVTTYTCVCILCVYMRGSQTYMCIYILCVCMLMRYTQTNSTMKT